MDNPVIWKDSDHVAVWMFLQLTATHKERQAIFGKNIINLKQGQLITGRKAISDKTGVEQHKVERILKQLKSAHLIEQQTCTKGRLISLLNWEQKKALD